MHQDLAKVKNALTIQIHTKNIKLANFLYKRKISDIFLSTCSCEQQRQTMKHVIVSYSLHDRSKIKNDRKTRNYRNLINTTAELKIFIR